MKRTRSGMNVIRKRMSKSGIKRGSIAFTTLPKGTLAISITMKRQTPKGGVLAPMSRLRTMIRPKWIGSIPTLLTRGRRTGVEMRRIAVVSIMSPAISRMKFNRRRMIHLLVEMEKMKSAKTEGISLIATSHPKGNAAEMMKTRTPYMISASLKV